MEVKPFFLFFLFFFSLFLQDFEALNEGLHRLLGYGDADLKEHGNREEGLKLIRTFLVNKRSKKVLDMVGVWTTKLFADFKGNALKGTPAGKEEAKKKAEDVRFSALLGLLG